MNATANTATPSGAAAVADAMKMMLAGGISVIPCDGRTKRPHWDLLPRNPEDGKPTWKPYQAAPAHPNDVSAWIRAGVDAYAAVCGQVSGGLVILDFDVAGFYEAWRAKAADLAHGLPVQRTGGGGYQVALRCPDPGKNEKLAFVADDTEETGRKTAIETRGEGGYAVLYPSRHPSGGTYRLLTGDFAAVPRISQARCDALLSAARQLDACPLTRDQQAAVEAAAERAHQRRQAQRAKLNGQGSVIDAFNDAHDVADVLGRHGYQWRGDRMIRPNADKGSEPGVWLTERNGRRVSFHHSSNDMLNDGHAHDAFSAFCHLDHKGDLRAAVRAAAQLLGMNDRTHRDRGRHGGLGAAEHGDGEETEAPSGSSGSGAAGGWTAPRPVPNEMAPVAPFDFAMLPDTFRPWIQDITDRIQCPADFPAVSIMVAYGSVVGRLAGIRPKRNDDWLVVPNLWGANIGRPGIMKTPAMQEPLKPLVRLEMAAKEAHDRAVKEHELLAEVASATAEVRRKKIKEAVAKGKDAKALAEEMESHEPAERVRRRYIVNDSTVEKVGVLLNENPRGLLNFRDELIGLLKALDKDGQEGSRAFYLESWNGTGRFTYDRIGRGTLDIEACCLSVLGGIQPGPLSEYLRSAATNGAGDDGLLQRFQLAVWPDVSTEWRNVDRWPNGTARDAAHAAFARADAMTPADIGAEADPHDPTAIPFLRFAADAQAVFDEWRAALEAKVRSGQEHPAIESHLAKYRSLVPSLALLIHLADAGAGPVPLVALTRAILWAEYLETHARRIFGDVIAPGPAAAKALARKISEGALGRDGFALKDVYRPGWSRLSTSDDAGVAVDILVGLGWLREVIERTDGAPRTRYLINPLVEIQGTDSASGRTAKTAKRPSGSNGSSAGGTNAGEEG